MTAGTAACDRVLFLGVLLRQRISRAPPQALRRPSSWPGTGHVPSWPVSSGVNDVPWYTVMTAPGLRLDFEHQSVYQEPPRARRSIPRHCRNVIIICPDRYRQPPARPVPPPPARHSRQPAANGSPQSVKRPFSCADEDEGSSVLVGGSLADRLGRKLLLLTGLGVFAVGFDRRGVLGVPSDLLIVFPGRDGRGSRADRAVHPCRSSTMCSATLGGASPGDRRPGRAPADWASRSARSPAGSPLSRYWWGSVFLVNVPIVVAVPSWPCDHGGPRLQESRGLLLPIRSAALLSIAGLGMTLWAIIEAPARGWTSACRHHGRCWPGWVCWTVFAAWEARSSHPMLNSGFFS